MPHSCCRSGQPERHRPRSELGTAATGQAAAELDAAELALDVAQLDAAG